MKGRQRAPRPDARERKGADNFSFDIDRPSRSEILEEALRRLNCDLEEVRKLTHNA